MNLGTVKAALKKSEVRLDNFRGLPLTSSKGTNIFSVGIPHGVCSEVVRRIVESLLRRNGVVTFEVLANIRAVSLLAYKNTTTPGVFLRKLIKKRQLLEWLRKKDTIRNWE